MLLYLRIIVCFITSIVFLNRSNAQSNSQIRLKLGASKLFISPAGKGYAYNIADQVSGSVVIGGEFSHTTKNKKGAWQVGFTFQDGYENPTPNEENIIVPQSSVFTFSAGGAPAKTVIYIGYERFIRRDYTKKFKNYFSAEGGLGFAFTLNSLKHWKSHSDERYLTRTGDSLVGTTYTTSVPSFPIGLAAYAGMRYNVVNKMGNTVFIFELLLHWGFTSFYNERVDYKLSGVSMTEILKENGNCLELNFVVPLFGFGNKSNRRQR